MYIKNESSSRKNGFGTVGVLTQYRLFPPLAASIRFTIVLFPIRRNAGYNMHYI